MHTHKVLDFTSNVKIEKSGITNKLTPPHTFFSEDIAEPLGFNTVSCELFCFQIITNLTLGHKVTFQTMIANNTMTTEFRNNYEKFLNQTLLLYKKSTMSIHDMQNRCEIKETCRYALTLSRMMTLDASPNLDQQKLKTEYDKLMKGSYKDFNMHVVRWNKSPQVSSYISKSYPKVERLKPDLSVNYTIYQSIDEVNDDTCRMVGDYEFLNRTVDMSLPIESNLNSNLNLLVFNSKVFFKKINNGTVIVANGKGKKVCSYVRENGILKHIQTWEF